MIGIRDEITKQGPASDTRAELDRAAAVVLSDGRTVAEVIAGAPAPLPETKEEPREGARYGRALFIARTANGGRAPEGQEPLAARPQGRAAMMHRMANGGKLPGEGGSR